MNRDVIRPPGFHRSSTKSSVWTTDDGQLVSDPAHLDRLARLRIPPAWTHVWASLEATAPLQATGIDARGRTQSRYSAEATSRASASKFEHLFAFARTLPAVRSRVSSDLESGTDLSPGVATAAAVRLLDRGFFRVGNERYASTNHTYGLTTLTRSQVRVSGDVLVFDFSAKEHLHRHIAVEDPAAANVVRSLIDQPGGESEPLWNVRHEVHVTKVDSATVNAYLHTHGGAHATAKVFRTWGATVVAAAVSADMRSAQRSAFGEARLAPYRAAAMALGNTVAVARSSYVHPRAVEIGHHPTVVEAVAGAAANSVTLNVFDISHNPAVQNAVLNAFGAAT